MELTIGFSPTASKKKVCAVLHEGTREMNEKVEKMKIYTEGVFGWCIIALFWE
jgi:hypothetical protein